jgi:hypothetical protein
MMVHSAVTRAHPEIKWVVNLPSQKMKNVHQSLDHNAILYQKQFLDAFVPAALTLMTTT